ncbi:MAG: hypothetical protein DRJ69_07410 [Thermoprotei archaeon]|nr:MAG: hypothetical protein DRJ69_07410 [Thermoprotei archaeon]
MSGSRRKRLDRIVRFRVSRRMYSELDLLAEKYGVSISDLIRCAIIRFLGEVNRDE